MQTSRAARRGDTFRGQCEILCLEWSIGFETDGVTTIAKVKNRTAPGANRTALQSVVFKVNDRKVFTVAAVLPLEMEGGVVFAMLPRKVQFAEHMASILALDWALSWREEAAFVFMTEYFHCRHSLRR
jgi:hypothetical protein